MKKILLLLTVFGFLHGGAAGAAPASKPEMKKPMASRPSAPTLPALPIAPLSDTPPPSAPPAAVPAASDDVVLYGGAAATDEGITLSPWGGGDAQDTSDVSLTKGHALKVTTLDPYQGGTLTFQKPVDFDTLRADKTRTLTFVLRPASVTRHYTVLTTPSTQGPGSRYPGGQYPGARRPGSRRPGGQYPGAQYPGAQYPGAIPGAQYPGAQYPGAIPGAQYPGASPYSPQGGAQGGRRGGRGRRRGQGGYATPGFGGPPPPGFGGYPAPGSNGAPAYPRSRQPGSQVSSPTSSLSSLRSVHMLLTFAGGQQVDVLRPYPTPPDGDPDQWLTLGVPLAALGTTGTGSLQSITLAGDDYSVFYVGEVKVVRDTVPLTCYAGDVQTVSAGDPVTLSATGQGGDSALVYTWDFDASDGITAQATGRTVTTNAFLNPKKYTVTLTVSDVDGLKQPATSTTTVTVR